MSFDVGYILPPSAKVNWMAWHVNNEGGQGKPQLDDGAVVVKFIASNHELEYIKKHFLFIPITQHSSCQWTDEMARFIYDNL